MDVSQPSSNEYSDKQKIAIFFLFWLLFDIGS